MRQPRWFCYANKKVVFRFVNYWLRSLREFYYPKGETVEVWKFLKSFKAQNTMKNLKSENQNAFSSKQRTVSTWSLSLCIVFLSSSHMNIILFYSISAKTHWYHWSFLHVPINWISRVSCFDSGDLWQKDFKFNELLKSAKQSSFKIEARTANDSA